MLRAIILKKSERVVRKNRLDMPSIRFYIKSVFHPILYSKKRLISYKSSPANDTTPKPKTVEAELEFELPDMPELM